MFNKIVRYLLHFQVKTLKFFIIAIVLLVVAVLAFRIYFSKQGGPLELWHTYVPQELKANQLDATDWPGYLKAEQALFDDVKEHVTDKLPEAQRFAGNRYYEGSPIYPPKFVQDWNRSYILESEPGKLAGAVILLHGLTDSPYSLRHIARMYQSHGFVVVAIRLPAHGTVIPFIWIDWRSKQAFRWLLKSRTAHFRVALSK
jgi:hypothetical protein